MADVTKVELSVVPAERREKFVAYARAVAAGEVESHNVECTRCGRHYLQCPGWYADCPNCTEQPEPLEKILRDETRWPGPGWLYDPLRGARGRWVELGEYFAVKVEIIRELCDLIPDLPPHAELFSAIGAEIKRLQAIATELDAPSRTKAEQQAKRALELADQCQRLADQLRAKRAECDELRDRVRRSRTAAGTIHFSMPEEP